MTRIVRFLVASALLLTIGAAPRPAKIDVAAPPSAPISLSDTDGQELILEDLSVKTAVQGMLSLTELELRFRNPKARRIEGRFSCVLPANAAISRFAKEVNGQLMEGEVVERLRANQVYEQFLHQMRDPALLEQDQGNRFSARIFPIDPNATVRILLSYSKLLPLEDGVRRYALPLRGIATIKHFTFRAYVTALAGEEGPGAPKSDVDGLAGATHSTADVISFDRNDYTPDKDIELTWRPRATASRTRMLQAGEFYLAAFRPDVPMGKRSAKNAWTFYVDTSASSAEGAEHRIHALEQLLGALPEGDAVKLVAFDQEIVPLGSGTAAEMSRNAGALLRKRLFLGGTDLAALFRRIATAGNDRDVVVVSDLVATLGDVESHDLHDAIQSIPSDITVHALILGSREDAATAKALTAGRGRIVRVPFSDSIDQRARDAALALIRPLGASFDVADNGAQWVYPSHFDDVRPDDEIIVLGRTKPAADPKPRINGVAADAQSHVLPAGTFAPLLEREAYRAYLDYLAEREANEPSDAVRSALSTEQVKVSVERRVVIPRTTMLVLETEWDYQRFGINRTALASILTIDAGGIGLLDRSKSQPVAIAQNVPPQPMPVTKAAPAIDGIVTSGAPPVVQVDRINTGGGTSGGRVDAPPPPAGVTEAIVVTAEAPMLDRRQVTPTTTVQIAEPPPAPRPTPVRDKKITADWTQPFIPPQQVVDALQAKLNADPRDRDAYNKLSDALVARGEWAALRTLALQWQPYDPENPQVYEVLGIADEQLGKNDEAARADASLIEVAAAKPELLQRAGLLLLRTHHAKLAETPLRRALELRPDRANSYRHLALMLWQEGRYEEAARVLESATRQQFPQWYLNVQRVIREELGYVYRGWLPKEPSRRADIEQRARDYAVDLKRVDALRITLAWETDANDVDLHVVDPNGEECYYEHKNTATGLELYEDITQGLGPEVVRTETLTKGTYHIGVNYFAAGPMGVSRGIVVVARGEDVRIYPFRLVEGGRDMRYVTSVTVR